MPRICHCMYTYSRKCFFINLILCIIGTLKITFSSCISLICLCFSSIPFLFSYILACPRLWELSLRVIKNLLIYTCLLYPISSFLVHDMFTHIFKHLFRFMIIRIIFLILVIFFKNKNNLYIVVYIFLIQINDFH